DAPAEPWPSSESHRSYRPACTHATFRIRALARLAEARAARPCPAAALEARRPEDSDTCELPSTLRPCAVSTKIPVSIRLRDNTRESEIGRAAEDRIAIEPSIPPQRTKKSTVLPAKNQSLMATRAPPAASSLACQRYESGYQHPRR